MKVCISCGERINNDNGICKNCSSRSANVKDAPLSRLETRKVRSKIRGLKIKRAMSVSCILLILCAAFVTIRNFTKNEPVNNVAEDKTIDQSKNTAKPTNSAENKEKKIKESPAPASPEYILPDSDKKILSQTDITALTKEQVRIARNEIYARHGYVFKSPDLQQYFSKKPWYHAQPTYGGSLNNVELENIKLLKVREEHL